MREDRSTPPPAARGGGVPAVRPPRWPWLLGGAAALLLAPLWLPFLLVGVVTGVAVVLFGIAAVGTMLLGFARLGYWWVVALALGGPALLIGLGVWRRRTS